MIRKVGASQMTNRTNFSWIVVAVVISIFTFGHLILWKNQLAQQAALEDLKNEVNSVKLVSNSVLKKLDGLPMTAAAEPFLFPTDQMYRGYLEEPQW